MINNIKYQYENWLETTTLIKEIIDSLYHIEKQNPKNEDDYDFLLSFLKDTISIEQNTINNLNINDNNKEVLFSLLINNMSKDKLNYYLTTNKGLEQIRMYNQIEEYFSNSKTKSYDLNYYHHMLNIIDYKLSISKDEYILKYKYILLMIYPHLLESYLSKESINYTYKDPLDIEANIKLLNLITTSHSIEDLILITNLTYPLDEEYITLIKNKYTNFINDSIKDDLDISLNYIKEIKSTKKLLNN